MAAHPHHTPATARAKRRGCLAWLLLASLTAAAPLALAAEAGAPTASWAALQAGGVTVLFRHAQAPGGGDPAGWRLDDCRTQRNLDDAGRAQARRIGQAFRDRGVTVGSVHHSRWCRTRETAELAFPGQAQAAPEFDSFFGDRTRESAQTAAARQSLRTWQQQSAPTAVVVVVTHQVNITALTGIVPDSGEGIVLRPTPAAADGWQVAGRIAP